MTPGSRVQDRLRALFASIDARDTDAFVAFLTEDAILRFASAPPVGGKAAIRESIGGFFSSIGGIAHELTFSTAVDDRIVCEGEVTYTRLDGSRVTLPFADVLLLAVPPDERLLISDYRIYADLSPLFAEPA